MGPMVFGGHQYPLVGHEHILNLGYPYVTHFDHGDVATAVRTSGISPLYRGLFDNCVCLIMVDETFCNNADGY